MRTISITHSASETKKIGTLLARTFRAGRVITVEGNLGAGKTVFAKGVAHGLGVRQVIQSPTFVLMKVYPVKQANVTTFVHVDCYRMQSADDLLAIGLADYLDDPSSVVVIEWPDRIREILPRDRLAVTITSHGEDRRRIVISEPTVSSSGRRGRAPSSRSKGRS